MKRLQPVLFGLFCAWALSPVAWGAGRQLSGQFAPAATPAMSPDEAQKSFTVPEGFEVRLFAAEPDVINPVAMTWDDRGRLWVVELYEYPLGAPAGTKGRDRVKILEDTDGDGRVDKVTVFADGLNLATGIQLGNGGVYIGQAPDLLFLQDTNGDDVADVRTTLMTGFGLEDRHELLNGFTWGPDGWLYLTHGVFTHSKVRDPNNPNDSGIVLNAAVGRFQPRTKRFEVFADGTSNPWGLDFDRAGNAFVSACVIDHFFHMAAGGVYDRQGGTPGDPYTYQLLHSIVDHKHYMAAYAGVNIYQGDQFPAEWQGEVLMGNIHQSAINHDHLTTNGSSFLASARPDFLTTTDGWFRPVSAQTGPDGALWVMDWYDKYPCYQNANADPEGVDRERGRIWRVVYTGKNHGAPVASHPANLNLGKLNTHELVGTLAHSNVWMRRMAQRLLNERRDPAAKADLQSLVKNGATLDARLAALWTLHGSDQLDDATLDSLTHDAEPAIRTWVARLTGQRGDPSETALGRLAQLAEDTDSSVRLGVATAARQFASGSLTIDTPIPTAWGEVNTGAILAALVKSSADAKDPLIPFMIWMAAEPKIAQDPSDAFAWLLDNGADLMPLSGQITQKIMRRVCDSQKMEQLRAALDFLKSIVDQDSKLTAAALDGLLEGQKGRAQAPDFPTGPLFAKLNASGKTDVTDRALRLGALWGDATAINSLIQRIGDTSAPDEARIKALQVTRQVRAEGARGAIVALLTPQNHEPLVIEAIGALAQIGGDSTPADLLQHWRQFSNAERRAAAAALVSRPAGLAALIAALEEKSVAAAEIPATVVRAMMQSKDEAVRRRAAAAIGRYREINADKLPLIAAKRKVVASGPIDIEAGHEIARKTCFVCHKLYGEGAEVGPDLTGVGRSTLDALLANVIDPNQIIGKGYENVEVETKDGRTVSGRLVEDTDTRVKLLSAGPKEEVIGKADITSLRVTEMSVMPEGLEQMPEQDFRNLIWFILNPPGDKRPLTPELRRQIIGDEKSGASITTPRDGESVALWNPAWRVVGAETADAPRKLPEFAGRNNVLVTRPSDRKTPASLERTIELPAGQSSTLSFWVGARANEAWQLRVSVEGEAVLSRVVDAANGAWRREQFDLGRYAGRKVNVRLENCARDGELNSGYWSDLELKGPKLSARAGE